MATSRDPFYSPKARLKRANQKIERLHKQIEGFFKKTPYKTVVELDADGVTKLHKFKFTKRLSETVIHTATESLEALRSALDQTGFAAAVVGGNPNPKRTQFPIGDDLAGLENTITGHKACKHVPDEIVALFRTFKPYKGGNDLLWGLNKLRNATHTALIPVAVQSDSMTINTAYGGGFAIPGQLALDPVKNEIIFARVSPSGDFKYDLQFSFVIQLGEIDVFKSYQAVAILRAISAEVRKIIAATEAECRRLGFIT